MLTLPMIHSEIPPEITLSKFYCDAFVLLLVKVENAYLKKLLTVETAYNVQHIKFYNLLNTYQKYTQKWIRTI